LSKTKSEILQGWKEIAAYVSRDERTVKRWEKQRGLPVRRMPGSGRANVFAVVAELDGWLSTSPAETEASNLGEEARETENSACDMAAEAAVEEDAGAPESAKVWGRRISDQPSSGQLDSAQLNSGQMNAAPSKARHGRWITPIVASALLLLAGGAVMAWRAAHRSSTGAEAGGHGQNSRESAGAAAGRFAERATYSSPVAGVDELYLRGVYSYEKRTPESLNYALESFKSAIDKDPKYAPAYAGLANTYNLLREYAVMPAGEIFSKARAAAETAIALDPKLAQAHAALGFTLFFGYWQPAEAEREFKTAIALDPNASLPRSWYGSILTHEARYPEALEQLDIAYRLQPSSAAIASTRAVALGLSGHRDEGADLLQEMINQDRDVSSAHLRLAILSLVTPRQIPRYLDASRRRAEMSHSGEDLALFAAAERAYRAHGEAAMWQEIIREERKRHPSGPTWRIADAEAALGENDAAMTDVEELVKERELNMIAIEMNPLFVGLHSDPRFQRVAAGLGLPKSQ
jgi:Tfp pilus assembly protein PilF